MKHASYIILSLLTALLSAMTLTSCGDTGTDSGVISYLPARVGETDSWGLVGSDGNMFVTGGYANMPSQAINGYFTVEADDGTGITVYRATTPPSAVTSLTGLRAAGTMTYGRIPVVRPDGRIELADRDGKTVATLTPSGNDEITESLPYFTDGLLIIKTASGRYGAVDTDGKTVITPGYTYLSPFCHDVALARTDTDNSTAYSLINTKGSTVMTFPEDMKPLSPMITAELLPVKRTEGCGFINLQGDYRAMPAKVTDIKEYNNDYFVYLSSDLHEGAMSIYYDEVLPAEYDRIKLLDSDRFVACAGGEWNLYNEKGAKVASLSDYKDVYVLQQWPFESDFSLMGRTPEDKINLLDENGREVTTTDFTNIKFNSYKSIVSDYLDINVLTEAVTERLEPDGFNDVKLGTPIMNLTDGNPAEYVGTNRVSILNTKERFYHLTASAYSSEPIAREVTIYRELSNNLFRSIFGDREITTRIPDHTELQFDSLANVNEVRVLLSVTKIKYPTIMRRLTEQISAKGYDVVSQSETMAVLRSPQAYIFITPDVLSVPDAYRTRLFIVTPEQYNSRLSELTVQAEDTFSRLDIEPVRQ